MDEPSVESRFAAVAALLEANARALVEYREWLQVGISEANARVYAFHEALTRAVTETTQAVTLFVAATNERITRLEGAMDAARHGLVSGNSNPKTS